MYPVFERVSSNAMFKSEIGIIKRTLQDIIKDGSVPIISKVYVGGLKVYGILFTSEVPFDYAGDIAIYSDKDYCMVGINLSGVRVDLANISKTLAKDAYDAIDDALRVYSNAGQIDYFRDYYPVIWDCIEKLGFQDKDSFSNIERANIIKKLATDYKPLEIEGIEVFKKGVKLSWSKGSNGLGIKDNDFMPMFIFDKSSYKVYYFDKDLFTNLFYYKTVKDMIKKKMLHEVPIDRLSNWRTYKETIGSPSVCLLKQMD